MELLTKIEHFITTQGVATALVAWGVFMLNKHIPRFMDNHEKLANSSVTLVQVVSGLESKVSMLSEKVEAVKASLASLTYEVKQDPPTRQEVRSQ